MLSAGRTRAGVPSFSVCLRPLGYTDGRLADGRGWVAFDVTAITCPVTALHGEMDKICNVVNGHHTAEVVPNARLVLNEDLGHFSIENKLIAAVSELTKSGSEEA